MSGPSRGGDEEGAPPCLTEKAKGKRKVLAKRKRRRADRDTEMAEEVAVAAERAERGGRGSGIQIGESRFHLEGRELGTNEPTQTKQTEEQAE
jgi:hypothetical protein